MSAWRMPEIAEWRSCGPDWYLVRIGCLGVSIRYQDAHTTVHCSWIGHEQLAERIKAMKS